MPLIKGNNMARQTKEIEIESGRDAGKVFVITEMAAADAEWWAFRALQAVAGADADLLMGAPLQQMAANGIKMLAKADPSKVKPLFDEMMSCVSVKIPSGQTRKLLSTDIEDLSTRLKLRTEVIELHVGFFTGGDQ